ncbi:MAG TPA: hypothetical protein VLP43_00325 [Solirubrobacteraceae bacterium]|nr:hypothetical protein [Solirubrobacteraceae bacterium]
MSYSTADGRAQVLAELERATDAIGRALTSLGDAYEWLDEGTADRMESELFRPAQAAYGRAQRTHSEFSKRSGRTAVHFDPAGHTGHPGDARGALERASAALSEADATLATLQDSMLPVEVGDPELRAGLSGVRELIGPLPGRVRELLRTLGR